ncbi:MAG: hypothetical protein ACOYBC_10545 [Bilifractor sp.]
MADDYKLGDGLKQIILAGIGAVAETTEKSSEIIEKLAKKGEITVEQGKELNKELKHNVKQALDNNKTKSDGSEDIGVKIASMGMDELEALKKQIAKAQEKLNAAAASEKKAAEPDNTELKNDAAENSEKAAADGDEGSAD